MHYGLPVEGFELVNTVLTNREACVFATKRQFRVLRGGGIGTQILETTE